MRTAPPIPMRLQGRDLTPDGLVIPWINVQLADGGVDFRSQRDTRFVEAWAKALCQLCGQPLTKPLVLLCGPEELEHLTFTEPPAHPECALYTVAACPMVGGHQERYATGLPLADRHRGKACPEGCGCDGLVPTPGSGPREGTGEPAHEWYAVYAARFGLTGSPDGTRITGGYVHPDDVTRVRQVSAPGEGRLTPPRPVDDWRDRYSPPAVAAVAR